VLVLLLLLLQAFQGDPPTTVFLLSIRSGAVGINLTAANHVFLLEPCINPALEEQAIGRAWRMGQTRKVVVKRFYVKVSRQDGVCATGEGGGVLPAL
jgi:SNF2 family DNA or RNA helicase